MKKLIEKKKSLQLSNIFSLTKYYFASYITLFASVMQTIQFYSIMTKPTIILFKNQNLYYISLIMNWMPSSMHHVPSGFRQSWLSTTFYLVWVFASFLPLLRSLHSCSDIHSYVRERQQFSKSFFFVMCPRNFTYLFLILIRNVLSCCHFFF